MGAGTPGSSASLPLSGLKVVEFVHMVMGPSCGLILADLGADVVKVEPLPDGDNTRRLTGSGAGFFASYNRNKRSLALDLKSPEGTAVARRLLAGADVMTENFRPGAMDRLGLGAATVRAANPRLVYCSLKGFLDGPYAGRVALDEVAQMMGGLAYMTGPPGRPLRAGASVNDVMGGMFAVIAILAALQRRQHTGEGAVVQAGLFENNVFLMGQHMAVAALTGTPVPPMSVRRPAWGIYDVFETRDGGQVFVGVVTDTQWRQFCERFERPDLAADERLAGNPRRVAARDWLVPEIARLFAGLDRDELLARCEACGLPFAPINRPEWLFDDPHLNAAGGLIDVALPDGRSIRLPALPVSIDGVRPPARTGVPAIGEGSDAVLQELGYGVDEIAALRRAQVVGGGE
ncbi:MAG: CaiB/BaiF CoA-transferase family protein [Thalassobaculales bacterium]